MEVTQVSNQPDIISLTLGFTLILGLALAILGSAVYFWKYFVGYVKYKDREKKSLEYVLLQITVPRDNEVKIDATEQLFATFASIRKSTGKFFGSFKPQPSISFEIVAIHESIRFFVSCHKSHQDLVEKQIHGAYPDAEIKEVPEYNIFTENGSTAYSLMKLKNPDHFPVKTFKDLPTDPLSSITSSLAKMQPGEGASVQVIISPSGGRWKDAGKKLVELCMEK